MSELRIKTKGSLSLLIIIIQIIKIKISHFCMYSAISNKCPMATKTMTTTTTTTTTTTKITTKITYSRMGKV